MTRKTNFSNLKIGSVFKTKNSKHKICLKLTDIIYCYFKPKTKRFYEQGMFKDSIVTKLDLTANDFFDIINTLKNTEEK